MQSKKSVAASGVVCWLRRVEVKVAASKEARRSWESDADDECNDARLLKGWPLLPSLNCVDHYKSLRHKMPRKKAVQIPNAGAESSGANGAGPSTGGVISPSIFKQMNVDGIEAYELPRTVLTRVSKAEVSWCPIAALALSKSGAHTELSETF